MKIVLLSNIFPPHVRGGYELGCRDIGVQLVALGHEVTVLTSRVTGKLARGGTRAGLRVREIFDPVFAFEADLGDMLADSPHWNHARTDAFGGYHSGNAIALHEHLLVEKPDLVWIFNPIGLGPVGIFETVLAHPVRSVLLLMDDLDFYIGQSRRDLTWAPRWRRLKRSITAISCSEITRRANERLGAFRSHRVVSNGIDFSQWPFVTRDWTTPEPTRFVYVGQVEEHKGVLQFVRGLGRLAHDAPELPFTAEIVGGGTDAFRRHLRDAIAHAGLAGRIKLTGYVKREELPGYLRAHHAAVMLLRPGEPFGYAPLEAAAMGLPVVLTRETGLAEFLPEGYPFLIANRDDEFEVAQSLRQVIQRRPTLAEFTENLRRHLEARCELATAVMPQYFSVIDSTPLNTAAADVDAMLASVRTYDDHETYRSAS